MVLTETMNFHANHIGAIRTNKEQLKLEFNVGIDITRRRRGEYQDIDITGATTDIRRVKKALQIVVDNAEFDRQEYLERKRRRESGKPKKEFKTPAIAKSIKKPNSNPFALLEGLDEAENSSYSGQGDQGVPGALSDTDLVSEYEIQFPTIKYDPNVSWGDMSDDDE
jgi:hypothetical protein